MLQGVYGQHKLDLFFFNFFILLGGSQRQGEDMGGL